MIKQSKIILITLAISTSLFASNGEEVFKENCLSCHVMKKGWQVNAQEKKNMQGPTAFGITKHVREVFSNEEQFVEFVSDYITNPAKIKSKCKVKVLKRFGLMPAIGAGMNKEDKEAVASWMFNNIGVVK